MLRLLETLVVVFHDPKSYYTEYDRYEYKVSAFDNSFHLIASQILVL